MTILSVIRELCPVIGLKVPDAVFSSTQREHIELQALANEMAKRIAFDTHDWSALKALGTITGDGTAGAFSMPTDYRRMLKKANLWSSSGMATALFHIADTDQWLGMLSRSPQWTPGAWTIIGRQIQIRPIPSTGTTIQYYYLSNGIVISSANAVQQSFMADTDSFALDERVLRLGMVWQWRANKGLAYAEDLATYEEALSYAIGADKGSNTIVVGRRRMPYNAGYAYPGTLGGEQF